MKSITCCGLLLLASCISAFPEGRNYKKPSYNPGPPPGGPVSAALQLAPVGPPKPYAFAYEVIDPLGSTNFGHRETSDGNVVEGEYRVALPDGRTQIVTYRADENGYVADVRYEGLVQPFVPPPPPPVEAAPAPLVKRNSSRIPIGNPVGKADGRPIVKRNENTSTDDFEFSADIKNVKEVNANKRQHKNQQQQQKRHQKQQKQKQPEYYQPQAYHPF